MSTSLINPKAPHAARNASASTISYFDAADLNTARALGQRFALVIELGEYGARQANDEAGIRGDGWREHDKIVVYSVAATELDARAEFEEWGSVIEFTPLFNAPAPARIVPAPIDLDAYVREFLDGVVGDADVTTFATQDEAIAALKRALTDRARRPLLVAENTRIEITLAGEWNRRHAAHNQVCAGCDQPAYDVGPLVACRVKFVDSHVILADYCETCREIATAAVSDPGGSWGAAALPDNFIAFDTIASLRTPATSHAAVA